MLDKLELSRCCVVSARAIRGLPPAIHTFTPQRPQRQPPPLSEANVIAGSSPRIQHLILEEMTIEGQNAKLVTRNSNSLCCHGNLMTFNHGTAQLQFPYH